MSLTKVLAVAVALGAAFTAGVWFGVLQSGDEGSSASSATSATASGTVTDTASSMAPVSRGPAVTYDGEAMAYGDYVMVSAKKCLAKLGFLIDAKTDRKVSDAPYDLQALGEKAIPGGVVIHLGANGGATSADLDAIMKILGPDRVVVFSTIQLPDDPQRYTFEKATNDAIGSLVLRYPNVRIMSWNALSLTNVTWLNADGSMTDEGCKAFALQAQDVLRATM